MHTACVRPAAALASADETFVVGKNYRLQDIQLLKNTLENRALEDQRPLLYRPLKFFRLRPSSLANASNFIELVCPPLREACQP
jgi:hypothetical protein